MGRAQGTILLACQSDISGKPAKARYFRSISRIWTGYYQRANQCRTSSSKSPGTVRRKAKSKNTQYLKESSDGTIALWQQKQHHRWDLQSAGYFKVYIISLHWDKV